MQDHAGSNSPARRSRRAAYWLGLFGAAAGLATWVYDYEFFLNAAGPETPISDAILRATGAEHTSGLFIVFWPAAVLVLLGTSGGLLVGGLLAILLAPSAR